MPVQYAGKGNTSISAKIALGFAPDTHKYPRFAASPKLSPMNAVNTDALATLFQHLQVHSLPHMPYEGTAHAETADARQQWVSKTINQCRRHNELDQIQRIVMFRRINKDTYAMQQPLDALMLIQTNFEAYLAMFAHNTPLPFNLTDVSSLDITRMWPPMIRDMQRYAAITWALQSSSFSRPSLVGPGHPQFAEVRTSGPMNNPAFRDRREGCGVVERFALAFYCQFRFDMNNPQRNHANRTMVEDFILSGAIAVIITLMKSYRGNESIQMYLCFFLSVFFVNAERLAVLRFTTPPTHLLHTILAAERYKLCRGKIKSITPIVSRNICAAVMRFPYMMNMRHLRYLKTYMTDEDMKTCNWHVCNWYGP